MLVLQLDSVSVDAVMGALNLHAAICQQTAASIAGQVTNQMQPPEPPAATTETTADDPARSTESPDGR